jgi:BMFP domain-containing protein YqiC
MVLTHSLKELLTGWLGQLGLVTRQEFDTQTQVLIRTRMKLEALEKELQNRMLKTSE